jgi:hypothetical protein
MPDLSSEMETMLALALTEARRQHSPILGTPHLFIALTQLNGVTAAALPAQAMHCLPQRKML